MDAAIGQLAESLHLTRTMFEGGRRCSGKTHSGANVPVERVVETAERVAQHRLFRPRLHLARDRSTCGQQGARKSTESIVYLIATLGYKLRIPYPPRLLRSSQRLGFGKVDGTAW